MTGEHSEPIGTIRALVYGPTQKSPPSEQAVFHVASAPISSRCPLPPLLLSAPNQNRHATQAKEIPNKRRDPRVRWMLLRASSYLLICQKPLFESSFPRVCSIVGMGWFSRNMALFNWMKSSHMRTFSFGFDRTTVGENHSVGASTFSTTCFHSLKLVLDFRWQWYGNTSRRRLFEGFLRGWQFHLVLSLHATQATEKP